MKTELNISLTYAQILQLVRQLPKQQKLKLSKELEKEAINTKLTEILRSIKAEDISQEIIDNEVEAVRQEMYAKSKKR